MTLTAQAGMSVAQLQAVAARPQASGCPWIRRFPPKPA